MIDATETLMKLARTCEAFEGRVFRLYPQRNLTKKVYCVITPTVHAPVLIEDGEEVIVQQAWNVQVVAGSPSAVDSIVDDITAKYGKRNILFEGISYGFSPEYHQYTAVASYSATVDRRGCVFI